MIDLPDYVDWDYGRLYDTITKELGWESPAAHREHADCAIHPITTYIHDKRFPGLEVRRLTLARLVQAGQVTRKEAVRRLREEHEPQCPEEVFEGFVEKLGMSRAEFEGLVEMGPRHLQFRPKPSGTWQLVRGILRPLRKAIGMYHR